MLDQSKILWHVSDINFTIRACFLREVGDGHAVILSPYLETGRGLCNWIAWSSNHVPYYKDHVFERIEDAQAALLKELTRHKNVRPTGDSFVNSLFIIKPYKWNNMWVFDDENVGLVREALVAGTDDMIDVATAHIPDADKGFIAIFSHLPFPTANVVLDWRREEMGGNVYHWAVKDMEGWLCPALFKYFPEAPKQLHIQIKPVG